MPTPIIGLFSECGSETQFSLVMVLAMELMEQGLRVLIVDADPVQAPFAEISGAPIPPGVSFLGLLHNPEARPLLVDCSRTLGNPAALARGGAIQLVPARAEGEAADPSLLARPPLQGARRFEALRESLVMAAQGMAMVLLVGAVSRSTLVTQLLAHACHSALLIADNTAKQVLWLAQTAREADALRGALIPSTCVECRDDGNAVPEGAWQELWRTHPGLLPPHRKGEEGPERLLILEDSKDDAGRLGKATLNLAQLCRTEGVLLPDDAPFLALYQEDRAQALAMFNTSIAPRAGTRTSAVAALHAVWQSGDRRWEDVQHLAKYVVQKFRWPTPSPEALELLPIYEALSQAADRGDVRDRQGRVLVDHAGMLAHAANWRLQQGEEVVALAAQVEALLFRARTLERTANDCARTAEVLSLHALLTQRWDHYDLALQDMTSFQAQAPRVQVLRVMVDVVANFAVANADLWRTVLELCEGLQALDPRYATYMATIAEAQRGRRREALLLLGQLYTIDRETYLMAFTEPQLRTLWQFGGVATAFTDPLPPHTR